MGKRLESKGLCGTRGGAGYVPPAAEVTTFALEQGFAATTDSLQGHSKTPTSQQQQTPAGQFGEQDWNSSSYTWN